MSLQVPTSYASNTDTVSSIARTMSDVGFSAAELAAAQRAVISVATDAIRLRKDGSDPSATVGHYVGANAEPVVIEGNADIQRLRFIRVTADAALYVDLEK